MIQVCLGEPAFQQDPAPHWGPWQHGHFERWNQVGEKHHTSIWPHQTLCAGLASISSPLFLQSLLHQVTPSPRSMPVKPWKAPPCTRGGFKGECSRRKLRRTESIEVNQPPRPPPTPMSTMDGLGTRLTLLWVDDRMPIMPIISISIKYFLRMGHGHGSISPMGGTRKNIHPPTFEATLETIAYQFVFLQWRAH